MSGTIEATVCSVDPAAWLGERGYDPAAGDLTKAIPSKRYKYTTNTAVCEAAAAGELEMCRFLWERGSAALTIRTQNSNGWTPLWIACQEGHLSMAKWLSEVAGVEDTRTKDNEGCTPMWIACVHGHFQVAKWLFEAGGRQ